MIPATLSIPALLGLLLTMMLVLGSRWVQALLPAEIRRKILHVTMGMVALSLPWIFTEPFYVWLLAALATAALLTVRCIESLKARIGGAIHKIQRKSYGELCFPVAIATLYSLAQGNTLLYLVPLLILTFGDSLAALVGIYHGRYRYPSPDGYKTLEGSLTMTVVSMTCIVAALDMDGSIAFGTALLIAFNLALLITLVEAVSWRGLDNFMIPVAGFYLLQAYLPMSDTDLVSHAFVNGSFALVILLSQMRWPLRD